MYRLGEQFVAKVYAPEAWDRYERERTMLELNIGPGRCPDLVESSFDPGTGGYLVMSALPGRSLSDVQQGLTATEYANLAEDLGACLAAVHAVPLTKDLRLPPGDLEPERRRHFDAADVSVDRLKSAQIVSEDEVPALIEAIRKGKEAAFATPRRLIHGDVHGGNVFLTRSDGRWSCTLIDFEEAGPGHVELDLVYPFLSILVEAFPGHRLAASWERIWRGFVTGYASLAGAEPDLELIVGHALAWYLWVAAHSLEKNHPKWRDFARIALDAYAVLRVASPVSVRSMEPRGRATL